MDEETTTTVEETPVAPAVPESGSKHWFNDVDADGNFNESWRTLLPEHLQEEKSIADFKNPNQLAEAFIATKAMVGKAANSTMLPQSLEDATDEDLGKLRSFLGAPQDATGYDLKRPEGMEESQWSDEQAGALAGILHKYNAPKELASELLAFDGQRQAQAAQAAQESDEAWAKEENAKLRGLWGVNYEERMADALNVAKIAGNFDENHPVNRFPEVAKDYAALAKNFKQDQLRDAATRTVGAQTNADKAKDAMTNPSNPLYAALQGEQGEEAQLKAHSNVQRWLMEPNKF